MLPTHPVKFTYLDYLLLPEDQRCELINGDIIQAPSPGWAHQTVSANAFRKLDAFVLKNKLGVVCFGPLDVVLSDFDVLHPDLMFISKDRQSRIFDQGLKGTPDLAIEILSCDTEHRDRVVKRKLYHRYGVRELWLVDPQAKTVEVVGWEGSEFKTLQVYPENTILKSSILEDFSLSLKEIFLNSP